MFKSQNETFTTYEFSNFLDVFYIQLAVTQGFGGADSREKAEWMITAVDQWFRENSECCALIKCEVYHVYCIESMSRDLKLKNVYHPLPRILNIETYQCN